MFMISASSASNEFTKKDDRFFRVHVANNAQRFHSFTKYIKDKNYKKNYKTSKKEKRHREVYWRKLN